MGAPEVISLAEVREKKQRAELRQQLHARFDHWIDALEGQMKEPKPTLEQISHAVWEARQALTGSLTICANLRKAVSKEKIHLQGSAA